MLIVSNNRVSTHYGATPQLGSIELERVRVLATSTNHPNKLTFYSGACGLLKQRDAGFGFYGRELGSSSIMLHAADSKKKKCREESGRLRGLIGHIVGGVRFDIWGMSRELVNLDASSPWRD